MKGHGKRRTDICLLGIPDVLGLSITLCSSFTPLISRALSASSLTYLLALHTKVPYLFCLPILGS